MMDFDSNAERYFSWWCDDLMRADILADYKRSESISLFPGLHRDYSEIKQLKTKTKEIPKRQRLLAAHVYTPDFDLFFDARSEAHGLFISPLKENEGSPVKTVLIGASADPHTTEAIVEIKPPYDQNNMTRLFKINQKWVYALTGKFVNLTECDNLFASTFTPFRYFYNDSGRGRRSIRKWEPCTLKEFLLKSAFRKTA